MATSPPTAIVTGGSSGIGLALTKHLHSKQWRVAILDLQPPLDSLPSESTLFVKTDVSSWSSNADAFAQVWQWSSRLDFCALNAGIDDRDDIFHSTTPEPPRQPNMLTFEVNLFGPYYGLKLAAHYMALNKIPGGKVVITASAAGLGGAPVIPQYCAAKHGLVGLTRSLGPVGQSFGVTVNAICPAVVPTNLAPAGLLDTFRQDQITPMSTVIRAFDELAEFDGVGDREQWVKTGHTGQTVEASLGNLYYQQERVRPDRNDEDNEGAGEAWEKAYVERNKGFALRPS